MGSTSVLAPVFGHSWDLLGQWELQQGVKELEQSHPAPGAGAGRVCGSAQPELSLLAAETRASHLPCCWQLSQSTLCVHKPCAWWFSPTLAKPPLLREQHLAPFPVSHGARAGMSTEQLK